MSGWTFEFIDKPGNDAMVRGMQARDAGDNAAAVTAFQQAVDEAVDYQTKARAMTQTAAIYLAQEPVSPQSAQQAIALLEQAEQLQYTRASQMLGEVYQHGTGVPVNYQKAYEYFSKVKDRFPSALISLAEITVEPEKARNYIAEAARRLKQDPTPSIETMIRLARHFREGTAVVPNEELAEYWYQRAVVADSAPAMMELATIWQENGHQPQSDIIDLWQRAAALNVDRAALELGFAYALGEMVPGNRKKSEQYFVQAVEMDPNNAYRIARWYEERGEKDPIYEEVAFNWFRVAAMKGHPDALIRQARAYWTGDRLPLDKTRAATLYHVAAQKGSDKALQELAERELRDKMREEKLLARMEEKERRNAARALQRARKREGGIEFWMPLAKQGDAEGMLRVGEAYMHGNGVPQDAAQGLEWMKKSASRGFGEAMYVLAEVHSAGLGVPMDLKKAYEWYQKSAESGYAPGQYQLGLGYARGIGVSEDHEKARKWLNAASKNGYSQAGKILESLTGSQS